MILGLIVFLRKCFSEPIVSTNSLTRWGRSSLPPNHSVYWMLVSWTIDDYGVVVVYHQIALFIGCWQFRP